MVLGAEKGQRERRRARVSFLEAGDIHLNLSAWTKT